jgi:hypothetical protein
MYGCMVAHGGKQNDDSLVCRQPSADHEMVLIGIRMYAVTKDDEQTAHDVSGFLLLLVWLSKMILRILTYSPTSVGRHTAILHSEQDTSLTPTARVATLMRIMFHL